MKLLFIILVALVNSLFARKIREPKSITDDALKEFNVNITKYKENALNQSYAGRAFLTWPNKIANKTLGKLCQKVANLVHQLQRQINDERCKISVYRSNNENGAMGQNSTALELEEAINRVATKEATPNDRMVCITTMGDIAQAMVDSQVDIAPFETTKEKTYAKWDCLQETYSIIAAFLNFDKSKLSEKVKEFSNKRSAKAMTKGHKTCQRKNGKFIKRSGIYLQGPKADEKLKAKGADKFIKEISWQLQEIEGDRLKKVAPSGEPWAGHITGSGPECFFMMDLLLEKKFPIWIDYSLYCPNFTKFTKDEKKKTYTLSCKSLDTTERRARAAIVLGFLQGAGFHSSFENHLSINQYLGFNYWPSIRDDDTVTDTGDTEYVLNATTEMNAILAAYTDEPKTPKTPKTAKKPDELKTHKANGTTITHKANKTTITHKANETTKTPQKKIKKKNSSKKNKKNGKK